MNATLFAIPLLSALTYALSAAFFKRAMHQSVGPWRICFVSNIVLGLAFAPLWFQAANMQSSWGLWQPALAGFLFFLGQLFNFLAIDRGDVSVATPMLGIKVILVAAFTGLLLHETIPTAWWLASAITFLAVWMLRGESHADRKRILPSLVFAVLGSTAFALSDIAVQGFAPSLSKAPFLSVMFAVNAGLSLLLIPMFRGRLIGLPRSTWRWLLPGALLFAASAAGISWAIANFGSATAVNVVYSARGAFSVLLIWSCGNFFGISEQHAGHAVMVRRLGASLLLVAAIALVTLEK